MTIDRGLNVFEPLSCIVLKPFSVWLHNRPQQFFGVTTHLNRFNFFKLTTGNLCFFMKTIQRGWVEPTDPNEGGGGSVEDSCLRLGAALGRHSSLLPKRCLTDCRFRTSDPFDCVENEKNTIARTDIRYRMCEQSADHGRWGGAACVHKKGVPGATATHYCTHSLTTKNEIQM